MVLRSIVTSRPGEDRFFSLVLSDPSRTDPAQALFAAPVIASFRCPNGDYSRSKWDVLMNRKVIVAILLVAAVPAFARAPKPRVTKDDAQKVVTIISGDKAKTQTYCEIQDLG